MTRSWAWPPVVFDNPVAKVDAMLVKTDRWLFAEDGVSEQSKQALAQVRAMLVDAQGSLFYTMKFVQGVTLAQVLWMRAHDGPQAHGPPP